MSAWAFFCCQIKVHARCNYRGQSVASFKDGQSNELLTWWILLLRFKWRRSHHAMNLNNERSIVISEKALRTDALLIRTHRSTCMITRLRGQQMLSKVKATMGVARACRDINVHADLFCRSDIEMHLGNQVEGFGYKKLLHLWGRCRQIQFLKKWLYAANWHISNNNY